MRQAGANTDGFSAARGTTSSDRDNSIGAYFFGVCNSLFFDVCGCMHCDFDETPAI
jgi:hypothetical protein